MKKMMLLLTLLSAGQMYGMEPLYPPKPDYMAMLPKEIKQQILMMLAYVSTVEEAVNAIRSLTETSKEFNAIANDPKMIRTIIQILVQKFNVPSEYIAQQLSIKGSEQYIALSLQLMKALWQKDFVQAEKLLYEGADIDFQPADIYPMVCGPKNLVNLRVLPALTQLNKLIIDFIAIQANLDTQEKAHQKNRMRDFAFQVKDMFDKEKFDQLLDNIDEENFKEVRAVIKPLLITKTKGLFCFYGFGDGTNCLIGAGLSFVMYAILDIQLDILRWLINHKANLNLTMGTGDTALLIAILLGDNEITELLIKNGADVNQKKLTKISEAISKAYHDIGIHMIIPSNYPGSEYDETFNSLIQTEELRTIMEELSGEVTPLLALLYNRRRFTHEELHDLFTLLLNNGANPDIQNVDNGNTPLMILTFTKRKGSANLMQILLDRGANPFIKNNEGVTPLDYIKSAIAENDPERKEKIQLLEDAMKKEKK